MRVNRCVIEDCGAKIPGKRAGSYTCSAVCRNARKAGRTRAGQLAFEMRDEAEKFSEREQLHRGPTPEIIEYRT